MTTSHSPEVTMPEIAVSQLKQSERHPALTILFHPDVQRIGEVASLAALDQGESLQLSRLHTEFRAFGKSSPKQPLLDRYLSRTPLVFKSCGKLFEIQVPETGSSLGIGGNKVEGNYRLTCTQLERGVVMLLARRVVLLLHYHNAGVEAGDDCGLVGESDGIRSVRTILRRVSAADLPVLLLGESGTGKELVARAIHNRSERRQNPLVTVNMAAIPDELAASELFGVRRGAFTGADSDRAGYFHRAEAGTLFLDEIGDCAPAVQSQLLRVLQEGEIQPPGGGCEKVDVRVLAATDADISGKDFSAALKHRLGGFEIHLPPLRERREDIGRLVVHLLPPEMLTSIGNDPVVIGQWAMLLQDLARYHWPGNVRELGNYCQKMAIASQDTGQLTVPDNVFDAIHKSPPPEFDSGINIEGARQPLADAEIKDAMLVARWEVARAARALQISRQALYKRIESIPGLRVAADIPVTEVEAVYHQCKGELEEAALRLQVSRTALRRRWRALELNSRDL